MTRAASTEAASEIVLARELRTTRVASLEPESRTAQVEESCIQW